MRAGFIVMAMGAGLAVLGQHMDAYVFGAFLAIVGLAMLKLKGV